MADPKLVEQLPEKNPHCSVCHGQYGDRRHVDFNVAYDGPVINEEDNIRVVIDDLIICEECLKEGAAVIGLKDPDEVAEYAEQLEKRLDEAVERIRGLERHNEDLRAAVSSKPEKVPA